MCLTEEWFISRGSAIDRLTYLGHADLDVFMSACGFTAEQLIAAGILKAKEVWSTAMLLQHEPTPQYKSLFVVRKSHDILMVKKGKGAQLVEALLKQLNMGSTRTTAARLF